MSERSKKLNFKTELDSAGSIPDFDPFYQYHRPCTGSTLPLNLFVKILSQASGPRGPAEYVFKGHRLLLLKRLSLNNLTGSILGPLLFLTYVGRLNSVIQHGELIQYADDSMKWPMDKRRLACQRRTWHPVEIRQAMLPTTHCH
ncbi:hypothetical protein J6590_090309 [Homalodisca vitripennis]|nr:hypothetical protein J6590_090309 [Homalodisca vitripennis]